MKNALVFIRAHSYEIFVTVLVLSLGVISRQLRQAEARTEAVAAIATPAPAAATTATAPAATAVPEDTWLRPVAGGVLTAYSDSQLQWSADMDCWQVHAAIDLAASESEAVHAAADGTVISAAYDPLLGLTVTLSHDDGYETVYASLAAVHCTAGERVAAGDVLGVAGNSADSEALLGCHLHFELLRDGLPIKPAFQ